MDNSLITLEKVSWLVSMKISDNPFFKTTPPILPIPPFIWEKSEPPSPYFSKILKISNHEYICFYCEWDILRAYS